MPRFKFQLEGRVPIHLQPQATPSHTMLLALYAVVEARSSSKGLHSTWLLAVVGARSNFTVLRDYHELVRANAALRAVCNYMSEDPRCAAAPMIAHTTRSQKPII